MIIKYPYLASIVNRYVPELKQDAIFKGVDMAVFEHAMQHVSHTRGPSYERLEFLGDAVCHMIIGKYIYNRYEEEPKGFLTKLRIKLERGDSLAQLTQDMGLDVYVQARVKVDADILEDVFEAFIAAFFLSFGVKYTEILLQNLMENHKDFAQILSHDDNYKDLLMRYFQQLAWDLPKYSAKNTAAGITSTVTDIFGKQYGQATCPHNTQGADACKKQAQQLASLDALTKLGVIVNGEIDYQWIEKITPVTRAPKAKTDKAQLSVFNPANKLIDAKTVQQIIKKYCILPLPKIKIKSFVQAMTHSSYVHRRKLSEFDIACSKNCVKLQKKSNDRLQFMGDAVIHAVIGELLYHKYPNENEGFMTRLRCKLENQKSLAQICKMTGISDYLLFNQTIQVTQGRENINIMSGGFEAFCGAIYMDMGYKIVANFMANIINMEMQIDDIANTDTNFKDIATQIFKNNHWGRPIYKTLSEKGPGHKKQFTIGLYRAGQDDYICCATAFSIKQAQQIASKKLHDYITNKSV